MITPRAPQHMDRWTRNERLYRHLLGLGLVVDPVFADEARTQIDHLIVSADLPVTEPVAQQAAQASVHSPMQRTQVGHVITSTERDRDNVVDFPPVL